MSDPLLGPRIKLKRANHHLIELERTETDFFEKNPCRIIYDTETQPGHKLAKIVIDARPPEIMHVLAGELIYQLRSALDQTAVAFARLSKSHINSKRVQFPTGDRWRDFKTNCGAFDKHGNMVGYLRRFDGDLRKAILRTKPYDGGNEILRNVFRMANIDKHMELIAINTQGGMTGMQGFIINEGGIVFSGPGDLNQGVVFSELSLNGTITPKSSNSQINTTGKITLGDVGPTLQGKPLVSILSAMVKEVRSAHDSFEDVLIDRGDMPPRTIFLGKIFNG